MGGQGSKPDNTPEQSSTELVSELFQACDSTGTVPLDTLVQAAQAWAQRHCPEITHECAAEMVVNYDADHDGLLNRAEFGACACACVGACACACSHVRARLRVARPCPTSPPIV